MESIAISDTKMRNSTITLRESKRTDENNVITLETLRLFIAWIFLYQAHPAELHRGISLNITPNRF